MKNLWWIGLSEAAMWLSVGAAIIIALFLTGKVSVLCFFLIPMFGGFTSVKTSSDNADGEDKKMHRRAVRLGAELVDRKTIVKVLRQRKDD